MVGRSREGPERAGEGQGRGRKGGNENGRKE